MKTIVITGSTRGIGYGLALAFLRRDCQVVISGRRPESAEQAAARLAEESRQPASRILAHAADVADYEQVQALWQAAAERFGAVDIWINNAGLGNLLAPLWQVEPEEMKTIVQTNLVGTMYGCKVAIHGMLRQGYGAIYNMEGYGSRGKRVIPGLTPYGSTKAGLAFLGHALTVELQGTPVRLGRILPGMLVTDLLLNQRAGDPADWERSKKAFNILADRVETVAPWIVEQVLKNDKHGASITWLTGTKVMARFLSAPFTKRNVID